MYGLKLLLLAAMALGSLSSSSSSAITTNISSNDTIPKTLLLHGWLPFWAKASGTAELISHQEYFNTISPFSLELNEEGVLFNRFENDKTITSLVNQNLSRKYKIVPTIAWFDAEKIDQTLQNDTFRKLHVDNIVNTVVRNKYDGIDIDYEGKYLKTKGAYSLFIQELSVKLHNNKKLLHCTVEARTPAEDLFRGYDGGVVRATDYKVLNKYCDVVKIMAYDQRDGDASLVYENGGAFYRPVADPAWVEKTIKEAIYEINRRKIVLGIPTYGNIYKYTKEGGKNYYSYVSAINYNNAVSKSKEYKVTPTRNVAGELQFSYKKDGNTYYVTYTDAVAVKKKLLLAEKYGLNGVSLFKIDGGMDPFIWKELSKKIKTKN